MTPASASAFSSGSLAAWLEHLERLHSREIDLGLERVGQVAAHLGLPLKAAHRTSKVLTFAGTNGKGSTLALTQAMAVAAGYRVGSYTSPHFLRFNERITLQGEPVSDAQILAAFEQIEAARLSLPESPVTLSYFEFATLAALVIFNQADLDVWLLEVGLGGRLDAVNLVDPDVALVISVALDHQDYLGDCLEGIGREKAGIFRAGIPAILGSTDLPASVQATGEALGCDLRLWGQDFTQQDLGDHWCWQGRDALGHPLTYPALPWPSLPRENAATGIQALVAAGIHLPLEAVQKGLAQAQLTGRYQRLGPWLLDVAHNPHAAEYLAQRLAQEPPCRRRLALVGMMRDKDQRGTLEPLLPYIDAWVVTGLPTSRALEASQLADLIQTLGGQVLARHTEPVTPEQILQLETQVTAGDYDQLLVFGSFFTLSLVLEALPEKEVTPCATV